MNCEHLLVNDGCNGEIVKHIGEVFPYDCVSSIFRLALHIKTIVLRDRSSLVIPS